MIENPKSFWEERYSNQETAWDIGAVSTPLKNYIDRLSDLSISILIPGCGNAYEAGYLLAKGASNLTLIDIAMQPVQQARRAFAVYDSKIKIIHGDFFLHQGAYDLILEQTFFCALQPSLRQEYADKMFALLKPKGKIAGLLFNKEFTGGPPFGGRETEYRNLFEKKYYINTMHVAQDSITPRTGTELFFEIEKPVD